MTGPYAPQAPQASQALDAADRPDFEQVLHQALNTPEIRTALRHGSADGPDLEELRSQALADAASIAVAAATEYGAYVRQRAPAVPDATAGGPALSGDGPGPGGQERGRQWPGGQGLLPALAVLTPVLATAATVVFLLLGHTLGLSASQRRLADTLLTAAHTTAVIAAVTTAAGAIWLFTTAARHRAAPIDRAERHQDGIAAARDAWRLALLERGVLPYLRGRLRDNRPQGTAELIRRPRLGYSSPDYASPDFASPDFASPDYASPDFSGPDFTPPHHSAKKAGTDARDK
ncbi:serine/threonine-protein kinase [Streptomyces milbemycinicus]|uniref:Transmembrane protein n=1 Tax=Streptomyces milbemycinicus TaxID=476552 RepID=A0ABW8M1F1_9ACTN